MSFHVQKMLHRQTAVQPLISSGQGAGAPPVNPPPAQPSIPVSQPQPVVSRADFHSLSNGDITTKSPCFWR